MNRLIRLLTTLLALATAGWCHAGGSVSIDDVKFLISTQPATHKWLSSTLEMPETVNAEVRFGNHYKHLGGARMGPYTFRARPKGSASPVEIDVTLCTIAEFYDKSGKRVTAEIEKNAVRIEEKLSAIMVRDARDGVDVVCPNP